MLRAGKATVNAKPATSPAVRTPSRRCCRSARSTPLSQAPGCIARAGDAEHARA